MSMPPGRLTNRRGGFTLVETLVVIFIIMIVAAITLPAIQAVRERARAAQCFNNLRQLALAAQSYTGTNGTFPMGTPIYKFDDIGLHYGHSWFVALLPYDENTTLYNSVNFNRNIYVYANQTLHEATLSVLLCPSDGSTTGLAIYPNSYQDITKGEFRIARTNYAACTGLWYHETLDLVQLAKLTAQDRGMSFANSAVRFSDVVDGTSNTFLLGERNHSLLDKTNNLGWHWWFDGYRGDTQFWTMHGFNPKGAIAGRPPFHPQDPTNPLIISASSHHPGGAHFAFVDGSVRFVKDSIDSWAIDQATGMPVGVTGDFMSPYRMSAGTRPGIYQSLSTRDGSEIVPDNY